MLTSFIQCSCCAEEFERGGIIAYYIELYGECSDCYGAKNCLECVDLEHIQEGCCNPCENCF